MRMCVECGGSIPRRLRVGDSVKNLCSRRRCLECLPFGAPRLRHNRDALGRKVLTLEQKKARVEYVRVRRDEIRAELRRISGGACGICGYNRCLSALEYNHMDRNTKLFCLSTVSHIGILLRAEVAKCVLVCVNCHREIEEGLISESRVWDAYVSQNTWEALRDSQVLRIRKTHVSLKAPRSPREPKQPRVTEEYLASILWEKPTVEIARELGITDSAVGKWAKKYGLVKPPRGYWRKLKAIRDREVRASQGTNMGHLDSEVRC